MRGLPSSTQMRDLALRLQAKVEVEHYLDARSKGPSPWSDRYFFKGMTFCLINEGRTVLLEVYGRGWLYRLRVGGLSIDMVDFSGDAKSCVEDFTMLKMTV